MLILIIIIVLAALLIIGGIGSYNGLVSHRNQVDEAFSTMDVYLKKRYDLIPNLVETVKGYAAHEKETLNAVMAARNAAAHADTPDAAIEGNTALSQSLGRLFALAENYPDLKASANFTTLQQELTKVEDDIAMARKYYNASVRTYNTKTESFPSSIFAGIFGFKKRTYYQVDTERERENVRVQF